MSAAFTPGPWIAKPVDGDWNIAYGDRGEHVLARVYDYCSEFQLEDAALIAAAPELYEVAGDALELLNATVITPDAINRVGKALEAALAKARGEEKKL